MSILSIIANAAQALQNAETQIGVTSTNIGNAQNPNYVQQNATLVAGNGGTQTVNVTAAVNSTLQQELLNQQGSSAGAAYLNQIYSQIQDMTGGSTGSPQLNTALQNLVTAFQDYSTEPESTATQNEVLTAAEGLVSTVQSLSSGIETIAGQVQNQTQTDVSSLNTDLATVASLNQQIITDQAQSQSTAGLVDQRNTVLAQIGALVPTRVTQNADGSIDLATPTGVQLVSGSVATQFTYTPYTLGNNGTAGTNASITVTGSGTTGSSSLNSAFTSGKIGSELNIIAVDDTSANSNDPAVAPLEKMRRQLDALVDQFYSSNASTPTAFQSAYNSATTNTGELASNLFVVNNQGPGGTPQPAGSDRFNFAVNPLLTSGTDTLKQASGNAVVQALTSNSSSTPISAGGVTNFTGTINALGNAITSAGSTAANTVSTNSTASAASLSAVQSSYSNSTGVSVDAQLSELIVLQNSYNASAKVISVINSVLQALESAVS
jgi:flagellar hook-associated protein 1 FlgK